MKKYDLVVPSGCFCSTTEFLRVRGLQTQSLPLDWIMPVSITQTVDYLENGFERFLEMEDLKRCSVDYYKHKSFQNTHSGIFFVHDFLKGQELTESFPEVKSKYLRRIERLYKKISSSTDILFFHIHNQFKYTDPHGDTVASDEKIFNAFERLKSMFIGKNVSLLLIRLSEEKNTCGYTLEASGDHCVIYNCYRDFKIEEDHSQVNQYHQNIHSILDSFFCLTPLEKLRRSIRQNLRLPIRVLCWFIPSQNMRKKLRGVYKKYY